MFPAPQAWGGSPLPGSLVGFDLETKAPLVWLPISDVRSCMVLRCALKITHLLTLNVFYIFMINLLVISRVFMYFPQQFFSPLRQ